VDIEDLASPKSHEMTFSKNQNYQKYSKLSEFINDVKTKNILKTHKLVNGGLSEKPTPGGALWKTPGVQPIADISEIEELKQISNNGLEIRIGGAVKISTFIEYLQTIKISKHIPIIATVFEKNVKKKLF